MAGIVVSFSRGAWIGLGAALLVLLLPQIRQRFRSWMVSGLLAGGAMLVCIIVLMVIARGSLVGGSTNVRFSFWRESLALLAQHPFGVGLDQFLAVVRAEEVEARGVDGETAAPTGARVG